MVKHGTQKKRRANQKVTRKARKHKELRVVNGITNEAIKKEWNKKISPSDNLSNFGLNADPNRNLAGSELNTGRKQKPKDPNAVSAAFVGLAKIPTDKELKTTSLADPNPKRRIMSEDDQEYVVKCIKKHEFDYEKMAKDMKRNYNQHTEAKMKKMCEKYMGLPTSEKLVNL